VRLALAAGTADCALAHRGALEKLHGNHGFANIS
jgi:hypothetical protein